jgi:flagellar biosynthesis/type III secretory pathway protein FliH
MGQDEGIKRGFQAGVQQGFERGKQEACMIKGT